MVGSAVRLQWQDNSLSETSFVVERATSATGPWVVINATVPPAAGSGSTVTYNDTTVAPGNVYWYRVKARNLVGDTQIYPDPSIGFPNKAVDSAPSNTTSANT